MQKTMSDVREMLEGVRDKLLTYANFQMSNDCDVWRNWSHQRVSDVDAIIAALDETPEPQSDIEGWLRGELAKYEAATSDPEEDSVFPLMRAEDCGRRDQCRAALKFLHPDSEGESLPNPHDDVYFGSKPQPTPPRADLGILRPEVFSKGLQKAMCWIDQGNKHKALGKLYTDLSRAIAAEAERGPWRKDRKTIEELREIVPDLLQTYNEVPPEAKSDCYSATLLDAADHLHIEINTTPEVPRELFGRTVGYDSNGMVMRGADYPSFPIAHLKNIINPNCSVTGVSVGSFGINVIYSELGCFYTIVQYDEAWNRGEAQTIPLPAMIAECETAG